jgi:hypothetical protein
VTATLIVRPPWNDAVRLRKERWHRPSRAGGVWPSSVLL